MNITGILWIWNSKAEFFDKAASVSQVRGEGSGALGSFSLPLTELLAADQLCLDRWFTLNNGQGQVLLRAQLGVSASSGGLQGGWTQTHLLIARMLSRACSCPLDPGVPALWRGSPQPHL